MYSIASKIVVASAYLVLANQGTTIVVLPEMPNVCDQITVEIARSFTEDCLWRVSHTVTKSSSAVEVVLDLQGDQVCDHVMVDRVFQIPIGMLPAGTFDIIVRWKSSESYESSQVTVAPNC